MSNHMPRKLWNEITYVFPNLNGSIIEAWERVSNLIPNFVVDVITNAGMD